MKYPQQAFSFVELLITVSIVILLTIIGLSVNTGYTIKANNSRIIADLSTVSTALIAHISVEGALPLPGGNKNYFSNNGDYQHGWTQTGTLGVYGSLTEDTLAKKYLDSSPKDGKTNNYFAYGITKPELNPDVANQFELSAILQNGDEYISVVQGNYTGEAGLYNLIRSYNGPHYVHNSSDSLYPYNPESIQLTASLQNITGMVSINGETENLDRALKSGDTLTLEIGARAEIYFSDGTVSILGGADATQETLLTINEFSRPKESNLLSQISLFLASGNIWTKATDLNDDGSGFKISTVDGTASVRGTIFGIVQDTLGATQVTVVQGTVDIEHQSGTAELVQVSDTEGPKSISLQNGNIQEVPSPTLPELETLPQKPQIDNVVLDPIDINDATGNTLTTLVNPENDGSVDEQLQATNCNPDSYSPASDTRIGTTNQGATRTRNESRAITNGSITTQIKYECQNINGDLVWKKISQRDQAPTCNTNYRVSENQCRANFCAAIPNKDGYSLSRSLDLRNDLTHEIYGGADNMVYQKVMKTTPVNSDGIIKELQEKFECDPSVGEWKQYAGFAERLERESCSDDNKSIFQNRCVPKVEGMSLYAKADYNVAGDIDLEKASGDEYFMKDTNWIIGPNYNISNYPSSDCLKTELNKDNSFCNTEDGKGIWLDNTGGVGYQDYLKYSGLDLDGDFVIEMSVKKSDLERSDGIYTLFHIKTDNYKHIKLFQGYGNTKLDINNLSFNISNMTCSNNFCNIKLIKKNDKCFLKINNTLLLDSKDCSLDNSSVYIGSNDIKGFQWNAIVDFLKLYN